MRNYVKNKTKQLNENLRQFLKFFFIHSVSGFVVVVFFFIQDVVNMFASVPDPDYPGHVILEQFQAQVRNGNSLIKEIRVGCSVTLTQTVNSILYFYL